MPKTIAIDCSVTATMVVVATAVAIAAATTWYMHLQVYFSPPQWYSETRENCSVAAFFFGSDFVLVLVNILIKNIYAASSILDWGGSRWRPFSKIKHAHNNVMKASDTHTHTHIIASHHHICQPKEQNNPSKLMYQFKPQTNARHHRYFH